MKSRANLSLLTLAIALVSVAMAVPAAAAGKTRKVATCSASPLTELMDKADKEAVLRFYSRDERLKVVEHGKNFDGPKCNKLLQQLKAYKNITVLSPKFYGENPNNVGVSPQCTKKPDSSNHIDRIYESIAPNCFNLDLDEEYRIGPRPHYELHGENPFTRDPAFLQKPRKEKEKLAKAYVTGKRNFEFYDLSKYLGNDNWGYFAEGESAQLAELGNNYALCLSTSVTIQKIIDGKTCRTADDAFSSGYESARAWPPASGNFRQDPIFHAFVDISGKLYRLTFAAATSGMKKFSVVMHPYSIQIFLDTIEKSGDALSIEGACTLSTPKTKFIFPQKDGGTPSP